jgi:hypothetical protein
MASWLLLLEGKLKRKQEEKKKKKKKKKKELKGVQHG